MSKSLEEFTGTTLYLDTSIFYALVRKIEPAARKLFIRVKNGEIQAYTSVMTFEELAYRIILSLARETYGKAVFEHWKTRRTELFEEFYPKVLPAVTLLNNFPNLTLLDVSVIDLMLMNENMNRCHLAPREALHLAAMQKSGCFDVVSRVGSFDCVSEVRRYTLL